MTLLASAWSRWALAASNCCLAAAIPARALATSASEAETWLLVLTEVMGTLTPAAGGSGLGVFEISLGAFVGDLVIGGIDFHQHGPGLHVLVVEDVQFDDVAGDASADGIDVTVDLGVIGGFVAGDVAVDEKPCYQQHYHGDDDGDAKAGTGGARRTSVEVAFGGRQGLGAASGLDFSG